MAVDAQGNAHIVWQSDSGGIEYLKLDEAGNPIGAALDLQGTGAGSQPEIAVDRAGNAHVVFGLRGDIGVMYVRVSAAGTIEVRRLVAILPALVDTTISYAWPSIALDPVSAGSDLPVVVAIVTMQTVSYITAGGGYDYFLPFFPFLPDPFDVQYQVPTYTYAEHVMAFRLEADGAVRSRTVLWTEGRSALRPNQSTFPAVAVDATGTLNCVWAYQNTDAAVAAVGSYVALRSAGRDGHMAGRVLLSPVNGTGPSDRASIVYSARFGDVHAAWRSPAGDGVVWYWRTGQPPVRVSSATAKVMGRPRMCVGDGLVRVVWCDERDGNREIYYRSIEDDAGAPVLGDEYRLTADPADSANPAIGTTPWGVPTIVWQDGRYGSTEILRLQPPWTFLLYMVADNDLESDMTSTLNGLEQYAANPCVNVIVQFDGFSNGDTRRFRMGFDGHKAETYAQILARKEAAGHRGHDYWYVGPAGIQNTPGEVNMSAPATLTDFIRWGTANFPASLTLLSVDDHGSGWRPGYGGGATTRPNRGIASDNGDSSDPTDDSELGIAPLRQAMEAAGKHFDVVFFEACLMALVEVVYDLRERTDYLVCSQAVSYGVHGYYLQHVLLDSKALDVAKVIAQDWDSRMQLTGNPHTSAAIRCAPIVDLANKVDELVARMMLQPDLKAKYLQAWSRTQKADDDGWSTDLHDFCRRLREELNLVPGAADIRGRAQAVMDAIAPVVVANFNDHATMRDCNGLSIYFPFLKPDLGIAGLPEDKEENPGAFVPVSDDPLDPAMTRAFIRFYAGRQTGTVSLTRTSDKLVLWAIDDASRQTGVFPAGANEKTWDLSVQAERDAFNAIRNQLWVELWDPTLASMTLAYSYPVYGGTWTFKDTVTVRGTRLSTLTASSPRDPTRYVRQDTTDSDATPTNATLYLCEDGTRRAVLTIDLTADVASGGATDVGSSLRWLLRPKGTADLPANWSAASGDFASGPVTVTWTGPEGGTAEREYELLAWLDSNGDGIFNPGPGPAARAGQITPPLPPPNREEHRKLFVTVIRAGLDAMKVSHNAANGALDGASKADPGAFVPVNDDDDDDNGVVDGNQTGPIPGETDMLPIVLRKTEPVEAGSQYALVYPGGFAVWRNLDRTSFVGSNTVLPADVDTTLYVEGLAVTSGVLTLNWWKPGAVAGQYDASLLDVDTVKVTALHLLGAQSVPDHSIHRYTATGAPPGCQWTAPVNGTLVTGAGTPDATILWGAGPAVGKAVCQVNSSYVWDVEVNLVEVKVETPANAFAAGVPVDGGTVLRNGMLCKVIRSGSPGLVWQAAVTLNGPNGDRGVSSIEVGFVQTLVGYRNRGIYTTSRTILRSNLEVQTPFLDTADGSAGPWWTVGTAGGFWDATRVTKSKTITARDSPVDGPPLTAARGATVSGGDDILDSVELRQDYVLDVCARTVHMVNGAGNVYTRRATVSWSFQGDGTVGQGSPYPWAATGASVTCAAAWTPVTDGSQPAGLGRSVFRPALAAAEFSLGEAGR